MPSSIHYRKTARLLQSGGVIAYPTEGVYGLGCAPDDAEAVMHILNIKGRRLDAGLNHGLGHLQTVIHQVHARFIGELYGHQRRGIIVSTLQNDFTVAQVDNLQ